MTNYIQYTISCKSALEAEIIVASLAEQGFESFTDYDPQEQTFDAYVPQNLLTELTNQFLKEENLTYKAQTIQQQNWNAQWESNFSPIDVDGRCYIRATFHEPHPSAEYEIIITPKMSFGTGHHPTTHLVVQALLDTDLNHKQGLDMGSGTGILAILAAKLGAKHIDAVDIDDWAYENCTENIGLNNVTSQITPLLGDAQTIAANSEKYNFIVANINRNIILADLATYTSTLAPNGTIILSGFLEIDIPTITRKTTELNLHLSQTITREGWACLKLTKK